MKIDDPETASPVTSDPFDSGSHESFYEYYKKESLSPKTMQRFGAMAEVVIRVLGPEAKGAHLDVLDIGCGAGAQSRLWTDRGYQYVGIDVNEPLIRLARERVSGLESNTRFEVGSAKSLPFKDATFDICLMPELLEHVADWRSCLNEAVRVLRPNGLIYISTSNKLCPKQREFNLFGYSWYPGFIKRYVERRAVTDWPAVANYAKYPAVNWFSFYQLRRFFRERDFRSFDRFDVMRLDSKSALARATIAILRSVGPLRFVGHVLTEGTIIIAQSSPQRT